MRTIAEVAAAAYDNAVDHGFHPEGEEVNVDQKLLLIIGEIIEAQNEIRDGVDIDEIYFAEVEEPKSLFEDQALRSYKPEGFIIELADAVIRIFDLAEALDLDIEDAIELKMAYNATRPHKHGKAF